ncbi:MAG: hypothetical protein ACR2GR_09355 [Rhodothermales bacterium]
MKHLHLVWLLACCLTLASCRFFTESEPDVHPGTPGVYAGLYSQGFEDSVFRPCGIDEDWKLVGDDSTFSDFSRRSAEALAENPAYVRLRGTPSRRGTYEGFFVTYDRQFTMTDVVEVRGRREGDCS